MGPPVKPGDHSFRNFTNWKWTPGLASRPEGTGFSNLALLAKKISVAGAEGIEPSNAGIKIQCLSAWLRPNYAPVLATRNRGGATIPAERGSGNGRPPRPHICVLAAHRCPGYNRALAAESSSAW